MGCAITFLIVLRLKRYRYCDGVFALSGICLIQLMIQLIGQKNFAEQAGQEKVTNQVRREVKVP